ncbi:MAG: transcriptional repressor LexA [Huintestinicola sp.]
MKDIHKKVLEYITERIEDGYTPTVREICRDLDIASTSTAARYINYLVDQGFLEKMDGRNRAIRLAGRGASRIPLVGTITAGQPITAIEDVSEYISVTLNKSYSGELFALKIRGESMINAGILNGDIVIIEKTDYVDNGEIAAVMVDGCDATVKRFYKEDGHYRLQPENDEMEPIYADECFIIGRVAAVVRYL